MLVLKTILMISLVVDSSIDLLLMIYFIYVQILFNLFSLSFTIFISLISYNGAVVIQ